jgi:hypothetical protein
VIVRGTEPSDFTTTVLAAPWAPLAASVAIKKPSALRSGLRTNTVFTICRNYIFPSPSYPLEPSNWLGSCSSTPSHPLRQMLFRTVINGNMGKFWSPMDRHHFCKGAIWVHVEFPVHDDFLIVLLCYGGSVVFSFTMLSVNRQYKVQWWDDW